MGRTRKAYMPYSEFSELQEWLYKEATLVAQQSTWASKKKYHDFDWEDVLQECQLALLQATGEFDPDWRGFQVELSPLIPMEERDEKVREILRRTFLKYSRVACDNAIGMYARKEIPWNQVLGENVLEIQEDQEGISRQWENALEADLMAEESYNEFLLSIKGTFQEEIFNLHLRNKTQAEIGETLGISQAVVSRQINQMKEALRGFLYS